VRAARGSAPGQDYASVHHVGGDRHGEPPAVSARVPGFAGACPRRMGLPRGVCLLHAACDIGLSVCWPLHLSLYLSEATTCICCRLKATSWPWLERVLSGDRSTGVQEAVAQYMPISCLTRWQFLGWTLRDAADRVTLIALCAARRELACRKQAAGNGSEWRAERHLRSLTPIEFKETLRTAALKVREQVLCPCASSRADRELDSINASGGTGRGDEDLARWCESTSRRIEGVLSVGTPSVRFLRPLDARQIEKMLRRGVKLPELA
jgi:hypothetical protein